MDIYCPWPATVHTRLLSCSAFVCHCWHVSVKRRWLILSWLISWSFLTHTMGLCRLTDLEDDTLWQKDGGGQQSRSGNLFSLCTCSHKRIGDHMTKPEGRCLAWDCINALYAVSPYMFFICFIFMLLSMIFFCKSCISVVRVRLS